MAAIPYAHVVAKKLEGKKPKGTRIGLAPNPKDIVCNYAAVNASGISNLICSFGVIWLCQIAKLGGKSSLASSGFLWSQRLTRFRWL
jgi:hypothetical protein